MALALFRRPLLVRRAGRALAVILYWHLRSKGSPPCFSDAIEIIIAWVWRVLELDSSGLQEVAEHSFANRDMPEEWRPPARHQYLQNFSLAVGRIGLCHFRTFSPQHKPADANGLIVASRTHCRQDRPSARTLPPHHPWGIGSFAECRSFRLRLHRQRAGFCKIIQMMKTRAAITQI
jgi:hypothetical protein